MHYIYDIYFLTILMFFLSFQHTKEKAQDAYDSSGAETPSNAHLTPTKRPKMSKILEMAQSSHPSLNIQLIGGQLTR